MENKPHGNMPDLNVIKGFLALILGAAFIFYSFSVVLQVMLLFAGFLFIYAGIVLLRLEKVVGFFDSCIRNFKQMITR